MPTCETCGAELVVKPDKPGMRTRWYECPSCDGSESASDLEVDNGG